MKINLQEITREINENVFAPESKWWYETLEHTETVETTWGKLDRYEVIVRIKASKYDLNGIKYQINHYTDTNTYFCFYDGKTYL